MPNKPVVSAMRLIVGKRGKGDRMKKNFWKQLVSKIHSSGRQAVISMTGGGSQAIGKLLSVPGGSRSLLEAVVPYSMAALTEHLGGEPVQACCEPTARAMAMAAWIRAKRLAADPRSVVGVGCTASLVSDSPKRGEHRIHVGVQTATETTSFSLTLDKGKRTRQQEERLAAKLLLMALGEACGLGTNACHVALESKLLQGEQILCRRQVAPHEWTELVRGERKFVEWPPEVAMELPKVLFPGAFNPLHIGHRLMAEVASEIAEAKVAYELSLTNVDKLPLDFLEIADRLVGIEKSDPGRGVLLTAAPTFNEKAELFPGTLFVVGADTLQRVADPHYYGDDLKRRDLAIQQIGAADCRFLVFGRMLRGGFCSLSDLQLPRELLQLCDEVSESAFREDISSTELRNEA